jgi:hypothetical protein
MFAKQSLDRAIQKGPGFGAYLRGSLTEKLYTLSVCEALKREQALDWRNNGIKG